MKPSTPFGWMLAGNAPQHYSISVDNKTFYQKGTSGLLQSSVASDEFGTLMQTFRADVYRGKRLRYTAWVKTAGVEKWCGLWMRIDGIHDTQLGFDNMHERSIKGTVDWKEYFIVLDVPVTAEHIAFGVLLVGKGKVWVDTITFDEVDFSVPVTGKTPTYTHGPVNLDFDTVDSDTK